MKKTSKKLKTEIEETQVKITQLEHREQILENRMRYLKQKDRKQRAHQLITRGAAIESIVPQVKLIPETAFYEMMEQILMLPDAAKIIESESAKFKPKEEDAA